jgi:hypothetical protein
MLSSDERWRSRRAARVVVAPAVWIRDSRRTRRFMVAALVPWSLLWVGLGVALLLTPHKTGPAQTPGQRVLLGVISLAVAAPGVILARRLVTTGLWIGRDGIVIRGPFSTQRVSLADADAFVPGVAGSLNGTPCPMLQLKPRGAIGVWALGREGVIFHYQRYLAALKPLCEELNAVLRATKSGP